MDRGAIWHEFADIPVYPVSVAMIDMAAPPDFLVKLVSAAANGGALIFHFCPNGTLVFPCRNRYECNSD